MVASPNSRLEAEIALLRQIGLMEKRRRVKHENTFEERLAEEAQRFRVAARELPPGTARELLLRRARQAETASNMSHRLSSSELRPPKIG